MSPLDTYEAVMLKVIARAVADGVPLSEAFAASGAVYMGHTSLETMPAFAVAKLAQSVEDARGTLMSDAFRQHVERVEANNLPLAQAKVRAKVRELVSTLPAWLRRLFA